jgi:hypothetical protein
MKMIYTVLLSLLSGALAIPHQHESRLLHNVTRLNKAGLAWGNAPSVDMGQFTATGKVGWYYTWSSWPNDQGDNIDYVPLLWGPQELSDWNKNLVTKLKPMFQSKAITCVLGMNEPQEKGQSNMTPQEGKDFWIKNIEPLRTQYGVRLGSPATSSAPSGKKWVQDWMQLCGTNCTVDFIALHYYHNNATDFIRYVTDFYETFQKPIWVTEWACQDFTGKNQQCNQQHVIDYMNVTQTWMETTDWIERYSWFGALVDNPITATNSLLTKGGKINPLGQQYIGEFQPNVTGSADENAPGSDSLPTYDGSSAGFRASPLTNLGTVVALLVASHLF